jgi:hypothetical protein
MRLKFDYLLFGIACAESIFVFEYLLEYESISETDLARESGCTIQ